MSSYIIIGGAYVALKPGSTQDLVFVDSPATALKFTLTGEGLLREDHGLVLDLFSNTATQNQPVILYAANKPVSANQQWVLNKDGSFSTKLDAKYRLTKTNNKLVVGQATGGADQSVTLQDVSSTNSPFIYCGAYGYGYSSRLVTNQIIVVVDSPLNDGAVKSAIVHYRVEGDAVLHKANAVVEHLPLNFISITTTDLSFKGKFRPDGVLVGVGKNLTNTLTYDFEVGPFGTPDHGLPHTVYTGETEIYEPLNPVLKSHLFIIARGDIFSNKNIIVIEDWERNKWVELTAPVYPKYGPANPRAASLVVDGTTLTFTVDYYTYKGAVSANGIQFEITDVAGKLKGKALVSIV